MAQPPESTTVPDQSRDTGGQIYRRRYTRYTGSREGRTRSYLALINHSVRRALGIRRKWTAKIIPIILYTAAFLPVIGFISVPAIFGADLIQVQPAEILSMISLVLLVFAAAASPEMLSDDRRENVLPLYYSRGLSRWDYLAAKLIALAGLMLSISLLPPIILLLGNAFLQDQPFSYLGSNFDQFFRISAASLSMSVYYASIGLAISAVTDRKGVASAIYIGFFLAGTAIAEGLYQAIDQSWNSVFVLAAPLEIPEGLLHAFFDMETNGSLASRVDFSYAWFLFSVGAFVVASSVVLYRRYLRED